MEAKDTLTEKPKTVGVEIICKTNKDVSQKIFQSFLKIFKRNDLLSKIQETGKNELCENSIFLFFNWPTLPKDIETEIGKIDSNGLLLMVIIVGQQKKEKFETIPSFTCKSVVRMWTSICSTENLTCSKTRENIQANTMLDCFISLCNQTSGKEVINVSGRCLMKPISSSKLTNRSTATSLKDSEASDFVSVFCHPMAKPYYKEFCEYMGKEMGITTHLIEEISQSNPYKIFVLCVSHTGIEKDLKSLEQIVGGKTTLIIIHTCEYGLPLQHHSLDINTQVFSTVVNLRFSDTNDIFYECDGNTQALKKLKTIHKGEMLEVRETRVVTEPKNRRVTMEKERIGPDTGKGIVLLCKRHTDFCKTVIGDFSSKFSLSFDYQWSENATTVVNSGLLVLVCLKVSRLADDIEDSINLVHLSDRQSFYLIIVHNVEPGVNADFSLPPLDKRVQDVANILHSDHAGCYRCPENKKAKDKFISWFHKC